MNLVDLYYINNRLQKENQFTKDQWTEIIDIAFTYDKQFGEHVSFFYEHWLDFEYKDFIKDFEDLLTDIENGQGEAIERFVNDLIWYFENN